MPLLPLGLLSGLATLAARRAPGLLARWAPKPPPRPEIAPGAPLRSFARPSNVRLDEIVLHESVSATREATVDTLTRKGYGVHYIVGPDGSITQHVAASDYCAHAGTADRDPPSTHNPRSIAVEVVSRCYPPDKPGPSDVVVSAPWMHRGRYLMPPPGQLEAVWGLVRWLAHEHRIPLRFPGVSGGQTYWGRIKRHNVPGVMAHARWHHSDGLVPEFYCLCRAQGLGPDEAWSSTLAAAGSGQRWTAVPAARKERA